MGFHTTGRHPILSKKSGPWVLSPRLVPGSRVALITPAGPLRNAQDLERAIANVESFGWQPLVGPGAMERDGYFAGPDAIRAADLRWALADDSVDAIWFLRGGYGSMRLLASVDYESLRRRPRALIGYSDITAFHSAVGLRCSMITYHGPNARTELTDFSRASLVEAVTRAGDSCGAAEGARVLRAGSASGRLCGGNLALLASLCGTPYAQSFDGAILLLEDVNEAVYRVDRMLTQLRISGALAGCRAIGFGHCTECPEESGDVGGARTLDDVLLEFADEMKIPCVTGLPLGHIPDQWTIPLGALASLSAPSTGIVPTLSLQNTS